MILLDTCTLIWWTLDPEKLFYKAKEICDRISTDGAVISSISIWELGIKIKKGKIDIKISIKEFIDRLKELGSIRIIPIDENIWLKNLSLEWNHKDPVDRTIVATALLNNLAIITKDEHISNYYPNVIW